MKKFSLEEQYKKYPECKREEVLKLQEWANQQPHLPMLDEQYILCFFHACYYSMEAAKKAIDVHFTTKTHCSELFGNLDFCNAELQAAMRVSNIFELTNRTQKGYRVVMANLRDTDASKYILADGLKVFCALFEQIILEGGVSDGEIIVIDTAGATLGHLARVGIMTMKRICYFLQEGASIRLREFHFINAVPFMDKVLALMKPFLTMDFFNLVKIHSSMDTFFQYVPQELLPSDYGGKDKSVRELTDQGYDQLVKNRDYFLEGQKIRTVNEKLRPECAKVGSDFYGAAGNFKKLEID